MSSRALSHQASPSRHNWQVICCMTGSPGLYPGRGASDLCCVTTASVASSKRSNFHPTVGHHCYLARVLLRGLKCPSSPVIDFKILGGFTADDDRLNVAVSHAVFGPDSCVSSV